MNEVIANASGLLSNLSACASLVIAPKIEKPVKQIQFVQLEPGKALIIMVMQNGLVENRIMEVPRDLPDTALLQASNYLNSKLSGQTLDEVQKSITTDITENKSRLDKITADLVAKA